MELQNETSQRLKDAVYNVLIVDDHSLMRDGLRVLLSNLPHVNIVAEAENGQDAIRLCGTVHPSIVLMDLNLPELDGIAAIQLIHRRFPAIRVLVLTATATEIRAAEAFNAGAFGYLLKRSSSRNLLTAIDTVHQGKLYLDAALDSVQINALRIRTLYNRHPKNYKTLTAREKQVLKLIAQGDRNRNIADKLMISLKTVEAHRLSVMQKLAAHNAAELTRWAYRLGMLDNDAAP
jgi:two-component system, LuxR family, secretion system response regulator SsrB